MRTTPFRAGGLIALLLTTGACATSVPSPVAPRLTLPTLATEPCPLPVLPDAPTQADLEAAYALRGAGLVQCDAARDLAVQTLLSERDLQDRWREQAAPKPFWKVW